MFHSSPCLYGGRSIDAPPRSVEDYQRLILDDLLYFFPGPYVMLTAYVDESGTHGDSKVACVAGLLYTREAVRQLDEEWKDALDGVGVRYFHAREEAFLTGEFKGKDRESLKHLFPLLIGIIRRYACGGAVAFITSEEQFDEYRKGRAWPYSQYTTCAYACVAALLHSAAQAGADHLDLTIESGHKDMGELNAFLRRLSEAGLSLTHGIRDKKDLRPLQTADLWAYEARKRVNDARDAAEAEEEGPVRLRKSLAAIVEGIPNAPVLGLNRGTLPVLFQEVRSILGGGTA